MAQLCFLIVASFLLLGKVYSPQFVMWLIPLVVLARPKLRGFAAWQAAEVFHWASVWLISAKINAAELAAAGPAADGEEPFGGGHLLFEVLYGLGIVAHMTMLIWLMVQVSVRSSGRSSTRPPRRRGRPAGRCDRRARGLLPAARTGS